MDKQMMIYARQLERLIDDQDKAHRELVSLSVQIHQEFPKTRHMYRQDLLYWLKKEIADAAIREFENTESNAPGR